MTPDEKGTWESRAQQDKARYDTEIGAYVPPPGYDARGVLIGKLVEDKDVLIPYRRSLILYLDQRPRKKAKRGPKDPAAPKRASGAYVFFTNEMRPKVLEEYPGIKFVDLGKELGARWRALTVEEKKRFEDMATEDKVRFQLEMQTYNANQQALSPPPAVASPSDAFYQHDPSGYGEVFHDAVSHHVDPYAPQHHYHT